MIKDVGSRAVVAIAGALLLLLTALAQPGECSLSKDDSASCDMTMEQTKNVAAAASDFVLCVTTYGTPTTYCEMCGAEKKRVDEVYDSMPEDCQSFGVFKQLRESLINTSSDASMPSAAAVWESSHCDGCEEEAMNTLNRRLASFYACLQGNYTTTTTAAPTTTSGMPPSSHHKPDQICVQCADAFEHVDNFHKKLPLKCRSNVDVVDKYHRMLELWSLHDCTVVHVSKDIMYMVLSLAVVVPVSFYWTVYLVYRNAATDDEDEDGGSGGNGGNTGTNFSLSNGYGTGSINASMRRRKPSDGFTPTSSERTPPSFVGRNAVSDTGPANVAVTTATATATARDRWQEHEVLALLEGAVVEQRGAAPSWWHHPADSDVGGAAVDFFRSDTEQGYGSSPSWMSDEARAAVHARSSGPSSSVTGGVGAAGSSGSSAGHVRYGQQLLQSAEIGDFVPGTETMQGAGAGQVDDARVRVHHHRYAPQTPASTPAATAAATPGASGGRGQRAAPSSGRADRARDGSSAPGDESASVTIAAEPSVVIEANGEARHITPNAKASTMNSATATATDLFEDMSDPVHTASTAALGPGERIVAVTGGSDAGDQATAAVAVERVEVIREGPEVRHEDGDEAVLPAVFRVDTDEEREQEREREQGGEDVMALGHHGEAEVPGENREQREQGAQDQAENAENKQPQRAQAATRASSDVGPHARTSKTATGDASSPSARNKEDDRGGHDQDEGSHRAHSGEGRHNNSGGTDTGGGLGVGAPEMERDTSPSRGVAELAAVVQSPDARVQGGGSGTGSGSGSGGGDDGEEDLELHTRPGTRLGDREGEGEEEGKEDEGSQNSTMVLHEGVIEEEAVGEGSQVSSDNELSEQGAVDDGDTAATR